MLAKIITFSRLRLIEKDYRTPIIATCLFLILVAVLLGLKLHDHAIVSQVLSQNSSTGQNYAELLSRDKVDKFDGSQVDTTDAPDNSASTKSAASSSTTFKTGAGSTTSSAPSASSGGGGSSGGTGSTPAPVQVVPFSAAITSFHEEKTHTTSCQHGSKLSDCSRTYYFAADVTTQSGPGKVAYNWAYSVSGSSNGSYNAATGTASNTLHATVTISCTIFTTFTAQFDITSPTSTQSPVLQIKHNCLSS